MTISHTTVGGGGHLLVGNAIEVNYYLTDLPAFDPVGSTSYPYLWRHVCGFIYPVAPLAQTPPLVGWLPDTSAVFPAAGLAIWTVITCCADALAVFMNGGEVICCQVITASIFGMGCVVTKMFFVHHFGVIGVPWATIITFLLLNALPSALYIPVFIRRLDSGRSGPVQPE